MKQETAAPSPPQALRIGCVSFLNAKPLIDGLVDRNGRVRLSFDVPAALLEQLDSGGVDLALCPIIDYHRSAAPLVIVPDGGIACDGPTLTVRLFSRVPVQEIRVVHADTDSHTSVALLRVVMREAYGIDVALTPRTAASSDAEALLLIGDKVVAAAPPDDPYRYGLDLGEAWKRLTGLPFVFAAWMARSGQSLGDLPAQMNALRDENLRRVDAIAQTYAAAHGWPTDVARHYLADVLRFRLDSPYWRAAELFARKSQELGLIDRARPLVFYPS